MAIRGRMVVASTAIALLALTAVPGANSSPLKDYSLNAATGDYAPAKDPSGSMPAKDYSLNAATGDYAPAKVLPAEALGEDGAAPTKAGRGVWLALALIGLGLMMMVIERRRIGAPTIGGARAEDAGV